MKNRLKNILRLVGQEYKNGKLVFKTIFDRPKRYKLKPLYRKYSD